MDEDLNTILNNPLNRENPEGMKLSIQALITKHEKRAYRQGWDSAGGEAMEVLHEQEINKARIEELSHALKNKSGMRLTYYQKRTKELGLDFSGFEQVGGDS